MKIARLKSTLPYLIFIISSCRKVDEVELYKERLVVYSILNPTLPKQIVIVDKTYELNESPPETTGLSGCEVKIWEAGGLDTVYFRELSELPGVYIDTEHLPWVKPKSTYHIMVNYRGGTLAPIYAHTTVPGAFNILGFEDGDTVSLAANPPLIWTKSEGVAIYTVWPFFCEDTTRVFAPLVTTDTVIPLFSYKETFFNSLGWYIIKVFANDTNRYEWGRRDWRVKDTLDTGYGLFGAQNVDTVKLYIKE